MNLHLPIYLSLIALHIGQAYGASEFPVTVDSCDRKVTFTEPPKRAVSQDVNLTSMMVALGLERNLVGYTGVTGWNKPSLELLAKLDGIPELASHYPSVETLLSANADFFFAGWNYGMRVGGDVTPQTLSRFGIQVYELTESCAQIMSRPTASLNDVYQDIENLGKIFGVSARAAALNSSLQQRQKDVEASFAGRYKPRIFIYDSGEERPFTAGRLAIPQALLQASGGVNVMQSVNASWTQVGWESVVEANPEVILIVDYGQQSAAEKKRFLLANPALQSMSAITTNRIIALPYSAMTPGIENLDAIEALANALQRWWP